MKASKLMQLIQSQMSLYGDVDIQVVTRTDKYTDVRCVSYNIYGTIEISI